MDDPPKVSVLMAVYNEEPYIERAVESILTQSYENIELVVIDDDSTDGTRQKLGAVEDPRVEYVENDRNVGFVATLNDGLDRCTGKYVARMDGDDIARRDRLAKQVRVLESNPDIGIVGSYWRNFSASGDEDGVRTVPETDTEIRWAMLLRCPFGHPTVTIERRVLDENDLRYSYHYPEIEDYELWPRVLRHTRGANIPEPLLDHRVHDESRYSQQIVALLREHDKIAYRTIREVLPDFDISQREVSQLRVLMERRDEFAPYDPSGEVPELIGLYLDLLEAFADHYRGRPGLDAAKRNGVAKAVHRLLNESAPRMDPRDRDSYQRIGRVLHRAVRLHPSATMETAVEIFGSSLGYRIRDAAPS